MTRRGLPRTCRLQHGNDIRAVLHSGHRKRYSLVDMAWSKNDEGHPRLGVIVPRYGHTAVHRNRLRRQLKECARCAILPNLSAVDLVVRARPAAYGADFEQLAGDLTTWLRLFDK